MSLFRAARLPALARPIRPLARAQWTPAARSFSSSDSPQPAATPPTETSGGLPKHQPDYDVSVEYRTSRWSPIPKRVIDGSESTEVTAAPVISGAPTDIQGRTVRIYKPAKAATQSGHWNGNLWRMDWDPLPKGHRWENPLMGWQSTADYMQGERLNFQSKEDAIAFANKQGYEYFVQEPNERKFTPKAYANNFLWSPKKLKQVRTK